MNNEHKTVEIMYNFQNNREKTDSSQIHLKINK